MWDVSSTISCGIYAIKVGISCMAISEPLVWINGQLQSLHNFRIKLLLLLKNAQKLHFQGPLTSWKFEPSPRPYIHSDPIINKQIEQIKKTTYGYILTCIELHDTGQNFHIEIQGTCNKCNWNYYNFLTFFILSSIAADWSLINSVCSPYLLFIVL